MRLRLTRFRFENARTVGRLAVMYDGLAWAGGAWHTRTSMPAWLDFGFACEDRDRGLDKTMSLGLTADIKIARETCIGVGAYVLDRTPSTRFADRCLDHLMLEVVGVTGFRGIRIHPGNTEADTEGCILPGLHETSTGVADSTAAWKWLDARVAECRARREACSILIERDPVAWAARDA